MTVLNNTNVDSGMDILTLVLCTVPLIESSQEGSRKVLYRAEVVLSSVQSGEPRIGLAISQGSAPFLQHVPAHVHSALFTNLPFTIITSLSTQGELTPRPQGATKPPQRPDTYDTTH